MEKDRYARVADSPLKVALHANAVLHNVTSDLWLVSNVAVTIPDPTVVESLSKPRVRIAV